jgi:hypothetical protein
MSEKSKDEIKEVKPSKTCFVIMPISDVDGYDEGHFTRVYEYIIKPACKNAGFEPIRADDTSKANVIIVDILQKILKADMAICDISSRNANVFYELGFRQAFNKKTVLIRDNKTDMPFDISSIRTLSYNANLRIDEVNNSVSEITKALQETESAKEEELNSLLNLLSIEKAALPSTHKMTTETSLILNAINELNYKLNATEKIRFSLPSDYQNESKFQKGDTVSFHINNKELFGQIISKIGNEYFEVSTDGDEQYILSRNNLSKRVIKEKTSTNAF